MLLEEVIMWVEAVSLIVVQEFNHFKFNIPFLRSKYDRCVCMQHLRDGSFMYLLFYVEDMFIVVKDLEISM